MAESMTGEDSEAFRLRCREFLSAHTISGIGRDVAAAREFQAARTAAGLAGLSYDTEYGGAGLTPEHERIYRSESAQFPAMGAEFVISHGMCLPVLNEFGTEEQKRQFMPDMISGKSMWCQMFSEPGAGSDVASLQTKAERDGDEWTINGQKVWTTLAHESEFGVIIARTDPEKSKHAGISMFIIDMHGPGVEIRPIHQIDGGKHFNEVFFSDVRIPADWIIGEYNNGWRQATAMLMYERVAIGTGGAGGIDQPLYRLLAKAATKAGRNDDPVVRNQLMEIYSMETTKSLISMRTRAEMKTGKAPGPGGSLGKLYGSVILWRFREIAMEIVGPASAAWDPGVDGAEDLQKHVLSSFMASIAGGTDEIQRNIIGDRVLGLPRDISVDTKLPFNELKVGTQRASGQRSLREA
jgi:alkylation response protein AidB-like acyl-CoA dehydrogenase